MRYPDNENIVSIEKVLNKHLEAVGSKNIILLREAFTSYAVFIGTDDREVWCIDQLVDCLEKSDGWSMKQQERNVYMADLEDRSATFFEILTHEKYGKLRGAGTVVKISNGGSSAWRISSYILNFSVPNQILKSTNILELLKNSD